MRLFWEHGYESSSLAQLKAAMGGISAASFYAAFGSKEALFREVVDRYLATHGQVTALLADSAIAPRTAVEQCLRASARMQTDQAHPLGCLVVMSIGTCSPESQHLQTALAAERDRNRAGLRSCVQRAIDMGELHTCTNALGLATILDAFLTGLSVEARDRVRRFLGYGHHHANAAMGRARREQDTASSQLPRRCGRDLTADAPR